MNRRVSQVIRLVLTPGVCRWCRCTYERPCANGCAWVDRAQTLCSECETIDTAIRTAKGRQALAEFVQDNANDLGVLHPAMPTAARPSHRPHRRSNAPQRVVRGDRQ